MQILKKNIGNEHRRDVSMLFSANYKYDRSTNYGEKLFSKIVLTLLITNTTRLGSNSQLIIRKVLRSLQWTW